MVHPHGAPDQHQKLIMSGGLTLVHAYRVWSTSVTAIVSYPARIKDNRSIRYVSSQNKCAYIYAYSGFVTFIRLIRMDQLRTEWKIVRSNDHITPPASEPWWSN